MLSVVVPVYNEEKNIQIFLDKITVILERLENHKESKYYKEVLRQFESLLPKSGPHVPKKSD
jgi:hypothetical protein